MKKIINNQILRYILTYVKILRIFKLKTLNNFSVRKILSKSFVMILFLLPISTFAADTINEAFGVNMHLVNRFDQGDWDDVVTKAKNNNVQWAREEFNWSVIEPTDNDYNWDAYDGAINAYNEAGIKVVGLITYSTTWASTNSGSGEYEYYAPNLAAWRDYVSTIATRYAGKVDYWEIWNEPNYTGFWKDTDEEYVEILEVASSEIKDANSNAKVILGGLSGSDSDFLQTVYDNITSKSYFDIIAIHPYRVVDNNFNYSAEQMTDGLNMLKVDLANIRAVAKANDDNDKPIWLTEFGWTTYDNGVTKKKQANYLMRGYAIALSVPKVNKVFWYSFADSSDDESYLESNFGLIKNDFASKKSLSAFKFLQNKLAGKKYQHSSLANVNVLDDFNNKNGWKFSGSVNVDGAITEGYHGALKVYYDFDGNDENSYLPIQREIKMPFGTEAISFKVKGSNDTTYLRVRIKDRKDEIFQYNLGYLPKNYTTFRLNLDNYSASWNGNQDGILDYPLYFESFILDDNPDGSLDQGYVYFDDLHSSDKEDVYLYKYKRGKKNYYLLWNNSNKSKYHNIKLDDASEIRVKTLKKNKIKKSSNNIFKLKVSPQPKWIYVRR